MRQTLVVACAAIWLLLAAASPLATAADYSGDGGTPDFYRWSGAIPEKPGVLLASQPLEAGKLLPSAAEGFRLLYSSRSIFADQPIAVSGMVYYPKGAAPVGGWPIIAWAHPTVGLADICAPSFTGESPINSAYLDQWLSNGFAVVTTDYEGLGTPGPHPYLNFRAEARGLLDSVRAATSFRAGQLANRVFLAGHSQGSGAAIGAAYIARDYAPDLHIAGTIASGLVIAVMKPGGAHQLPIPPWRGDSAQAAFEILYFLGLDRSFDPSLDADSWLTPRAMPVVRSAMTRCFNEIMASSARAGLTASEVFTRDISVMQAREPQYKDLPDGLLPTPVFAGIGLADYMAGLEGQYNFVSAACAVGTNVVWRYYPKTTHWGVVNASFSDSLAFAKTILSGAMPQSNCADLKTPGQLQGRDPSIPMND